jgi:hypothetical protein
MGDKRQSIGTSVNFVLEFSFHPTFSPHPLYREFSDLSTSSHFSSWKAWLQLVLRANQYIGGSDSKMTNGAIWSKMLYPHLP